ncbi:MAG: hypothetical protein RMY28_003125 [Nostoc sp. ChiSLP01]|nr:hypothetical protein [Nostoc sp. CmiSLP01]MDZ8283214.1 hypothetical protein [Nostoc sp. ChiSLP01]
MTPHDANLDKIAEIVSDKCKVPGCAGGTVHHPNNLDRLIGSRLRFGYRCYRECD